jgi:DegV family protein with EDD domain
MGKIAIVTDSTAHLEPDSVKDLDISVIPHNVHINGEILRDEIDISRESLFQRIERGDTDFRVLPPTVQQFQHLYSQIHERTDQILSIHVSGQLSQTLLHARGGTEELRGRCQITILDSFTSSVGLGLLAIAAGRLAREGATLDEVVRLVRGIIPHIYLVFYSDELDYLERNGHLSQPQAILGNILKIKPVLFVEDGKIMALEKVRTYERAHEKLYEFVSEFAGLRQAAVLHRYTTSTPNIKALQSRLQPLFPDVKFPVVQYDPILASHIGLSAVGVAIYEVPEW